MPIRMIGVIALVAIAAATVWWLDSLRQAERPDPVPPAARHEPEHYFDDFRLRSYEVPGTPVSILHGLRMVRFADDETSEITEPDLDYHDPAGPPWHVTGDRGTLDADGDRLDLEGDVQVTRFDPGEKPILLVTPVLTVFIGPGIAETDAPVDITGPGWTGTAVGMTARLNEGQVDFHHDFRGRHEGRR